MKDSVREKAEIRFMTFPKHLAAERFYITEPSQGFRDVERNGWALVPTKGRSRDDVGYGYVKGVEQNERVR